MTLDSSVMMLRFGCCFLAAAASLVPSMALAQLNCTFRTPVSLLNGQLILLQIANPETLMLDVQLTYDGEAWLSFGVSDNIGDHMTGSEVVIGKPDESSTPQWYAMSGQSQAAIALLPESEQNLVDPVVEQVNGQTIMRYSIPMNQPGRLPIKLDSETEFVYAHGTSNTFGYHGARGNFALQVSQCVEAGEAAPDDEIIEIEGGPDFEKIAKLWKVHGALMAISWGILVPIAIGASLTRNLLPLGPGGWFMMHQGCNMLAICLTIAGFGIAIHNVSQLGSGHFATQRPHTVVGLVVFILALLQAGNGLGRPHLPHAPEPDEEDDENKEKPQKSGVRVMWEYGHRLLGALILGLAWYNCHSGITLLAMAGMEFISTTVFWAVAGAIAGISMLGYVVSMAMGS